MSLAMDGCFLAQEIFYLKEVEDLWFMFYELLGAGQKFSSLSKWCCVHVALKDILIYICDCPALNKLKSLREGSSSAF